ncbi:MAG: hypothetical protein DYG98_15540 [Haliscomenobacteraceae bacterium CHB4]|nr:hypothetical protein [Saprospiraceae bacterium]MCE7924459.1 hypothetical protein [Haliscomenobacteraceae bacterium CHB4]
MVKYASIFVHYWSLQIPLKIGAIAAMTCTSLYGQPYLNGLDPDALSLDLRDIYGESSFEFESEPNSCWAHAVVAAYESNYMLLTHYPGWVLNLSESGVLCCVGNPTDGFFHEVALQKFKDRSHGFKDEGSDIICGGNMCNCEGAQEWLVNNTNTVSLMFIPPVRNIKEAICTHGAIAVSVKPDNSFLSIKQHEAPQKLTPGTGHAVVIMGWDDGKRAWLIRNSSGSATWGNRGYAWIEYGTIGLFAAWVEAKDNRNYLQRANGSLVACVRNYGEDPDELALFGSNLDCNVWSGYWKSGFCWKSNAVAVPDAEVSMESNIAAVWRNGKYYFFWISGNGAVNVAERNENVSDWSGSSGFSQIAPPRSASLSGSIAAISRKEGHIDVFWLDPEGRLYTASLENNAPDWTEPSRLPVVVRGIPNGSIALTTRSPATMDVFWTTSDGNIRAVYFDENGRTNKKWKDEMVLPAGNLPLRQKNSLSAVVSKNGKIHLSFITKEGVIAQLTWRGARWEVKKFVNARVGNNGNIASVIGQDDGVVRVFGVNEEGAVFTLSDENGRSTAPTIISAGQPADPARGISAVARANGIIDVFWTNSRGELFACWKPQGKDWALPYKI